MTKGNARGSGYARVGFLPPPRRQAERLGLVS